MEQASDKDTPIVKLNKPTIRVEGNEQDEEKEQDVPDPADDQL